MCSRNRLLVVVVTFMFLLSMMGTAVADTVSHDYDETVHHVFIELSSPPAIESSRPNQVRAIEAEQNQFRQAAAQAGINIDEKFGYQTLFNGISARVSSRDIPRILDLPGVVDVYPVIQVPIPEVHTSTDMINAPYVVENLDYDGKGILVAIIDTGIDYNHPDLGGGWGERVIGGWDFVGDEFDASDPDAVPQPNPDPMDPNGHGTHVAGIVGADGHTRGVAPGVDFLALKVFGAGGPTTADIILDALEMAYDMGADIVNMSLGAAYQWPQYPTARAADRLVQKGVFVSVSQGNSGSDGVYAGGAPSVASRVMATASFDNTHSQQPVFRLPDGSPVGYDVMNFSPPVPKSGQSPEVVYAGLGNTAEDYEGLDVEGKVVLVSRGAETFAHKSLMGQAHGAAKVIIHNNAPGNFRGTLGAPGDYIPTLSISWEHAQIMLAQMQEGPITLTWTDEEESFPNPTAGFISDFSSWGPAPDLDIKPDVGAPGGSIYAPYPLALGGYATLSGTSMAAPHVAGAAALMLEANPRMRPHVVKHIFRNTAVPQEFQGMPFIEPVHRQGAGMIDIYAAIVTETKVEPSKVSLGALDVPTSFELTIENMSDETVTYTLSHLGAITTSADPGVPPGLYLLPAQLSMPETVTIAAGSEAVVTVDVVPPALLDGFIFSGYVVIEPEGDMPAITVPYLGVYGDYLAADVIGAGAFGFPWLAVSEDEMYYRVDEVTIDLEADETAFILYNLARQARKVRITVIGENGRNWGRIYDAEYVGRSGTPQHFFSFEWDGEGRHGLVPDGVYHLKLEAQKPLGEDDNPEHWDEWISGPITVVNGGSGPGNGPR